MTALLDPVTQFPVTVGGADPAGYLRF